MSEGKIVEKILRDLRIGIYQLLIIKILLEKGPLHGYAIRKTIEELSNGRLRPSESTIYDTLKKLEKLRIVESFWGHSPFGGPMRKYYKVKDLGKKVLEDTLKEFSQIYKLIMGWDIE
ncbi:MAG: PadR family transcriptional regulator [Thermoprotei archaeon]|nr:MAG: PadR family transcriptional regulator [Thermoprotei archaeon]HDN75667.1 PadR family transcriptional regulator [Acidilobales archaeon]